MLLETATAVGEPVFSQKKNAKSITVAAADPRLENGAPSPSGSPGGNNADGTPPASYSGSIVERDFDGPKNMQAVTYPVVMVGVPVVVLAIAWFVSATIINSNYKVQKQNSNGGGGSSKEGTPNAAMFNVNNKMWNGDLATPLIHRSRRGD